MLIAWAKSTSETFREFVRPRLIKLNIPYECTSLFPQNVTKDDVVLAFGSERLGHLQSLGLSPKGRAITSQRGIILGNDERRFMVTWDADIINIDWARRPELIYDLRLAKRLHDTGRLVPDLPVYDEVDSFEDARTWVLETYEKTGNRVPVAVDLETVGTDYMAPHAWIVAVSVTVHPGQAFVKHYASGVVNGSDRDVIEWLCNDERTKVYGANFKFDMLWLCNKWGIETFRSFALDTTLVGSLLDENRSNSLNLHAKVYTAIGGYDDQFNLKYDKSRMDLIPKSEVVQYAGGDTDADYRVAHVMRKKLLSQRRLARFYTELLHPAQHAVRKMEQRGMLVDVERYAQLDDEVSQVMRETEVRMIELMPLRLRNKYRYDLKPSRPKIVVDFLFGGPGIGLGLEPKMLTAKKKEPSTSVEHFQMFGNVDEAAAFVNALMEFNKAAKIKSTYIDGFLKHLRSDGKFHPSYMLFRGMFHGAAGRDEASGGRTGRTSAKEPAVQTLPKHTDWAKPLRTVYVPPEGYAILDIDFSQGELRITACIANEPEMIAAYREGIDLHIKTGAQLNDVDLEKALAMLHSTNQAERNRAKKIRQGGKAGNFGLIYTMGADGFVDYARKSYGVDLTLKEAHRFIDEFFGLYKRLPDWHSETKAFAHKHGFVESPLGRVRRVPLINTFAQDIVARQERQAVNAGVQATLTDMGLLAMAELDRRYPDLWVFGFTHDALSFYVPEHEALEWAQRIKAVMEGLPFPKFGWHPQLAFPVDVQIGLNNLGELTELAV